MTFYVEDEINSQPDCWRRAAELAAETGGPLRQPGERVAVVGCGTSWFMAMAIAALREEAGLGETDAFAASEFPTGRRYDRIVALTRSGTTTEVVELLRQVKGTVPTVALVGDQDTPAVEVADEVIDLGFADESSVVQTRFATTALAWCRAAFGTDLAPIVEQAEQALQVRLTEEQVAADQVTFLGRGWTVGVAHEAALKFRESSSSWAESYPAMDYRHGPISIAAPGRLVWMFGTAPEGLSAEVETIGAEWIEDGLDAQASLVAAQRLAIARAMSLGLNPDEPRNLTRSIILTD